MSLRTLTAEPAAGPLAQGGRSERAPRHRWAGPLMLLAGGLLAFVAQVVRQPGVHGWDGLWQEDGTRFLTGAVHLPLWHALTTTYNGYLHVVPRLFAAVAVHFPIRWWAAVMDAQAAALVALLAVHLYVRIGRLLPARWARLIFATFFVLAPATVTETNMSVANLHWYLDVAAFAALLPGKRGRAGHTVDALVILLAALSDPLVALWLPLAAFRVIRRNDSRDLIGPAALVVGLAVQALAILTQHAPKTYTNVEPHQLPAAYALRVGGSFFVGDRFLVGAHKGLGETLTVLLGIALLLVAAATLWVAERRSRFWVAAALIASVAWFVVPILLRGTTFLVTLRSLNGSRYSVLPVLALALALLIAVSRPRYSGHRAKTIGAGIVVTFLIVMMVVNYRVISTRSAGPGWRTSVTAAALLCRGQPPDRASNVRRLPEGDVAIPVSPIARPGTRAPWYVAVPCSRVEG